MVAVVVIAVVLSVGTVMAVTRRLTSTPRAAAHAPRAAALPAPEPQAASTVPSVAVSAEPTPPPAAAPFATAVAAAAAPALPDFSAKRYLGKVLHTVPNKKHEVALTFDDGPGDDTGRVLEILGEHKIHATFFVVGRRARTKAQEVRDMAAQGHEVANHTWTHPEPGALSEAALAKEFDRNQTLITYLTGTTPRFARTRGGKFTDATMVNLAKRGLILSLWSIHSNDVEPSPSPEQIVKNATGGATSGSIILLHETNPNTVKALPAILKALERKGLHPVTMSQLLADDVRGRD